MGRREAILISIVVAIASLGVGCGGGGDTASESGATASSPKATFIKQADSVCAKGDEQTQEEFTAFAEENNIAKNQKPTSAQYIAITKSILIPAFRQQAEEIRVLSVPAGDKNRIDTFLQRVDEAIEVAEEKPVAAGKSPRKLLANADQTINGFGFKVCGSR